MMGVALSVAAAIVLLYFQGVVEQIGTWGYLGVFMLLALSSATVFLPTVGTAYLIISATTLNPFLLGMFAGLGAGLGELSTYYVGSGGKPVLQKFPKYEAFSRFMHKWGGLGLFLFGATPLPFDLAGLWAGTTGYPLKRFFLWVTSGKIVGTTILAYGGYYGVPWLLELFDRP
jgi:membrane-associated protein